MKAKTVLASVLLMFAGSSANAINSGYAGITEIKSWEAKNDIYLDVSHGCGAVDTKRYELPKTDNQLYALLLSAFAMSMVVNLAYNCNENGFPIIVGVRARKAP